MTALLAELEKHLNKKVVLDTTSAWVYIGTLSSIGKDTITLTDTDSHCNTDTASTKERYLYDTGAVGLNPNRKETCIDATKVISFSLLDDIIRF